MTAIEWDDDTFARILERLRTDGTIDATGARISSERLTRMLGAAREDPDRPGQPLLKDVKFDGATFHGDADFRGATFQGEADFRDTTFEGLVADFRGTTFQGFARFRGATFEGDAVFDSATFEGARDPIFRDFSADFYGATFDLAARFGDAIFQRDAVFGAAIFRAFATFRGAKFELAARFDGATFRGDAEFYEARLEGVRDFGPVFVLVDLDLRRTVFAQPVRIEASARVVSCSRAQFRGGADLLVRRAEVLLDDADFAEPSLLASRRRPVPGEETALEERQDADADPTPRLVSVRRAKVANLTIASANLGMCRFEGAHGLDRLRLEDVRFAETPSGWRRPKRWRLPTRWTRRQTIAEEHQWRTEVAGATGWYGPEVQASSGPRSAPQAPEQIAAIYRALRKGREDGKDEPGAADFYYGEMEMRRQVPRWHRAKGPAGGVPGDTDIRAAEMALPAGLRIRPRGERLILWLYWLVSGYGLRASRALIALAFTVIVFAFLFDSWGFRPDQGFGRALLFSVESTSSLFRVPQTEGFVLTAGGEVLQVILRLLGPLFFGLALLSLRGRVKR